MEFLLKLIMIVIGFDFNGVNVPIVTKGDGLYQDKYEEKRYLYKGFNPNNYIVFNKELWRVLSLDKNEVKLIRNEVFAHMPYDEGGSNKWNDSTLNKYLNYDYLNIIEDNYRKIVKQIELISLKEYLEINSNQLLCGKLNLYFKNEKVCYKGNYVNYIASSSVNNAIWTLTIDDDTDGIYYVGNTYFPDIRPSYDEIGVLPVVSLDNNFRLSGNGTLHNPFKIVF